MLKIILSFTALISLSACVMVPEIKMTETLEFNYGAPSQQPIGYADLLCCFDCTT